MILHFGYMLRKICKGVIKIQINGQDITQIRTLNSMYANNCLEVSVGEELYLMKVTEICKFDTDFCGLVFNIIPKRKHKYLEVQQSEEFMHGVK